MSSLSVTRTVGRKKRAQAAPRRFAFLPRFDYRRPFDSLWALFCSLRTAIVLIAALALIGVAGMLIPQAPEEVVSSPRDYAGWVAANVQPQFHNLTDFMNWLQLFTIFGSWYFKALVALLAINILVCSVLNRAPTIWRKFRHPQLKRADGFYANSPVKVGLTVGDDSDTTQTVTGGMRRFFTKRGYRVETAPGSSDRVTYLYVHKHAWSALSTLVFHVGMIGVMFSAVLTGWGGFGNNSMASRILPRPIYNYFQSLAGFSYDQPLPNGSQGIVYPLGTDHNIFYRAQNFVAVMDPVRHQPTDFYTDLQLFQDGKLVASKRIRVNDPLTYQGVTFHQASFMMYTDISLRDNKGNVLYSSQVPLLDQSTTQPDPNTGNVFTSNQAENVPIATYGQFMNIAAISVSGQWLIIAKGFNQNNQEIFQGGGIFGQGCIDANLQPTATGTYGCQLTNGWWLKINDVRMGTVLLVTKDSGSPLLWPVLAMMVIGLWVTFSFPPRRIWARIEGDQVRMATLKEHYINMQRELDAFARALGNRPLRPAPDSSDMTNAANGANGKKEPVAKKHATSAKKRDTRVASPV